jgi:hypothetical protein
MYNKEDKMKRKNLSSSSSSSTSQERNTNNNLPNPINSFNVNNNLKMNFKNFEFPLKDQLPYYYQQNMFPHNPINPFFAQKFK